MKTQIELNPGVALRRSVSARTADASLVSQREQPPDKNAVRPFRVDVPDEVLNDLQTRLKLTRWVDDFANDGWQYGTNTAYLKELVSYWIECYDWRKYEHAMNAYPQFRTEIDGVSIHFIHVRGKGPNPKPLILSHGWPWTFWEYHKVIGPRARLAAGYRRQGADPICLGNVPTSVPADGVGAASRDGLGCPANAERNPLRADLGFANVVGQTAKRRAAGGAGFALAQRRLAGGF